MSDKLYVLGCGSAMPRRGHGCPSYLLKMSDRLYLIDAGEGCQLRLMETHQNLEKMQNIFISHLHGDHVFGLVALLSTMSMRGRRTPLTIHAHADLEGLLVPLREYFMKELSYELKFNPINPRRETVIFEDRHVTVSTLKMKHSVPTCGFLFREKSIGRRINKLMFDESGLPLSAVPALRGGSDVVTEDGRVVKNSDVTIDPPEVKSFAYCSDTAYMSSLAEKIRGVSMMLHDSTYGGEQRDITRKYMHSTVVEAATVAKEAEAGKLVLAHTSSRYGEEDMPGILKEAQKVFEYCVLPSDGDVISF